ncbi:hypothetical protein BO83DRAFT_384436 [Aspergillus eucalypticola CBS 122712]|uniref:Uncharacterized protein n=1 Tax=Aspergillus eucalypticola (strain CBS 122712 / IBT 29274) TaxID=1448314 RepID=A0A317WG39_ASPEC|nr:uncharacterized protein BO83DRAFT_384436 [Aspergillus eucalypticola CBS 122712]PWY83998.1 hypothetical protein BO83DRAFT_384436 [Aspergillus eucalypticola CBS 122712]
MKHFTALFVTVFATGALADLHYTGLCYDSPGKDVKVFNKAATEKACASYKNRNTGSQQWDQCPDCTVLSDQDLLYYCKSEGQHIGGDELSYYCGQAGADGSLAW